MDRRGQTEGHLRTEIEEKHAHGFTVVELVLSIIDVSVD